RPFNERDTAKSTVVCIINEEFARRYFDGRNPLGAMINVQNELRQVVGVIRQVRVEGPTDEKSLEIYVPYTQSRYFWPETLAVRTSADPLTLAKPVQAAIGRVDKDLALTRIETLDEVVAQT